MKNVYKAVLVVGLAVAVAAPGSALAFVQAGQKSGFTYPLPPTVPTQTVEQISGVPYPLVAADGFYGKIRGQRKDNVSVSNLANYSADLALDASGEPAATWTRHNYSTGHSEVLMARWNGSKWTGMQNQNGPDNLSNSPSVGSGLSSIAFDHNDQPIVVWSEGTQVRLIRWTGSNWRGMSGMTAYDVVNANFPDQYGGYTSIAVSRTTGYPAVAIGNGQIYVVRWNGSTWNGFTGAYDQLTAGMQDSHSQPVLKIDFNGRAHVAWFRQGPYYYNRSIMYARFNGTNWSGLNGGQVDVINAGEGVIDSAPDLAIEQGTNVPAIVWAGNDQTGQNGVLFKHWNGGMWRGHNGAPYDMIPSNGIAGQPEIATALNGTIGVLYYLDTAYNIGYSQWAGGMWRGITQAAPQLVDPLSPGAVSDLEMDYLGHPNVLGLIGDNPSDPDQVNVYFTQWKDFPNN